MICSRLKLLRRPDRCDPAVDLEGLDRAFLQGFQDGRDLLIDIAGQAAPVLTRLGVRLGD
jgi:hypothetical protein